MSNINNIEKKLNYAITDKIPLEELITLPYFKNRDKDFIERCLIQDDQGMRELSFSDALKKYIEVRHFGDPDDAAKIALSHLTENTESKEQVVMNTFRWLITSVGRSVLIDALDGCGLQIVDKETGERF